MSFTYQISYILLAIDFINEVATMRSNMTL